MAGHRVYQAIVKAVREGQLAEPFTPKDVRRTCPGFAPKLIRFFYLNIERTIQVVIPSFLNR